jgi:hypothetical protein
MLDEAAGLRLGGEQAFHLGTNLCIAVAGCGKKQGPLERFAFQRAVKHLFYDTPLVRSHGSVRLSSA